MTTFHRNYKQRFGDTPAQRRTLVRERGRRTSDPALALQALGETDEYSTGGSLASI